MDDVLVAVSFFAAIFGIFYIRSRENMALIERGFNPRQQQSSRNYTSATLKFGLLFLGAGLGLLIAFLIDASTSLGVLTRQWQEIENGKTVNVRMRNDITPALYISLVTIGGGLGLLGSYLIERRDKRKPARQEFAAPVYEKAE